MTPINSLFRKLWTLSAEVVESGNVTDSLTDNDGYPFIHIKESYDQQGNNSDLTGTITQVIDVWGLREQRNAVDKVVGQLHDKLTTLRTSHDYYTRLTNYRAEQIPDHSTGTSYVRYRIEADFFYTKKEANK